MILHWFTHCLSKEKLLDYDSVCKVLGVKLDLESAKTELALISNTDDRVTELAADIDSVLETRVLPRKEGERLRGRLQFASSQLFGRTMRNNLRALSDHIHMGRRTVSDATASALGAIRKAIFANVPRRVSGKLAGYTHAYVDASFDQSGYSGVGGLILNSDGECLAFFSEVAENSLVDLILKQGQQTGIQELEMLSLLIGFKLFQGHLSNCKLVLFTDSEAVRGAFLKSWSANESCNRLIAAALQLEEELQTQVWLERVPSQSNPSDFLSRSEVDRHRGLRRTRCNLEEVWVDTVITKG